MKIAVYGGTFNPIHNAHIHLASEFSRRVGFDKVILIPANIPPHKRVGDLADGADRLAMCRLAAQEHGFEVSDIELRRQGPSYTADTLEELHRVYPEDTLYLITGEDMFLTLLQWRRPLDIMKLAVICAAPRSSEGMPRLAAYAQELEKQGGRTVLENVEYLPVSSTMVRGAVKRRESIGGLVPAAVAEYIHQHHLYEGR